MSSKFTLGVRIGGGFAMLVVLMVVVGAIGTFQMWTGAEQSAELTDKFVPQMQSASELKESLGDVRIAARTYGFTLHEADAKRMYEGLKAGEATHEKLAALLSAHPELVKLKDSIGGIRSSAEALRADCDATVKAAQGYLADFDELNVEAGKLFGLLQQMSQHQCESLEKDIASNVGQDKLKERSEKMRLVFAISDDLLELRVAIWKVRALRDTALGRSAAEKFASVTKNIDAFRAAVHTDEMKKAVEEFNAAFESYRAGYQAALAGVDEMDKINERRIASTAEAIGQADKLFGVAMDRMNSGCTATRQELTTASRVTLGGMGGALLIGVMLGWLITRSITRPIHKIASQLGEGSSLVAEASGQVNSSANELASAASEQASSLEETTSALEEMSSMTRGNAENAGQANTLVTGARDQAHQSATEMTRLNNAMTAINESSNQISKIIKVIEEIAFQTNLLALNAAVEAARAGEHGKGFAVVAEEVRNLAQRAAGAARETTELIEASVSRAKEGTDVAHGFGRTLGGIVDQVTKASDLVSAIHQASDEQARGVEQISTAVTQMDRVTQSIAASSEESAAAVEELSAQASAVADTATALAELVGVNMQKVDRHAAAQTIKSNIESRRQNLSASGQGARPVAAHAAPGSSGSASTGDF